MLSADIKPHRERDSAKRIRERIYKKNVQQKQEILVHRFRSLGSHGVRKVLVVVVCKASKMREGERDPKSGPSKSANNKTNTNACKQSIITIKMKKINRDE